MILVFLITGDVVTCNKDNKDTIRKAIHKCSTNVHILVKII